MNSQDHRFRAIERELAAEGIDYVILTGSPLIRLREFLERELLEAQQKYARYQRHGKAEAFEKMNNIAAILESIL